MRKVNVARLPSLQWSSPKKTFEGSGKQVSEALGRDPTSMNINERHPFDVEILTVPPGKSPFPFHSHSAQWEFYHVLAGTGIARDDEGRTPIEAGDAFIFKPGEAHQLINNGTEDLVISVIADNPIGESSHYPDSGKWAVRSPQRRMIRSEHLDYYDGEE